MQPFLILAGAALTGVVCLGLGLLLSDALRAPSKGMERAALAFLAGAALLSISVFLLAAAGLARWYVFVCLDALVMLASWRKRVFRIGASNACGLAPGWRVPALVLFGVFTAIYGLHAMAPEHSPDGSYYHLGFVSLYDHASSLIKITDNMYAHLPQGIEMLFLHAFSIGRHSAASLVEFTFLLALAALIYCYGRRIGQPMAGLAAAFFVYASPIVGWTGTRAYIDVAVAAIIFGAFYTLYIWAEGAPDSLLIPAGLLAGFAFGSKYTAVLTIPFGICAIVLARKGRLAPRPPGLFLGCATLGCAPWLLRNLVWLGNPFSPFLNRWFPNPYIFPSFETQYSALLRSPEGFSGWGSLPLEVTIRGAHLQGLIGPLFLLAPIGILAVRTRPGRWVCAAAIVLTATYPMNLGTRFLIPALPFLALAMGMVMARKGWLTGALLAAHAITAYPAVVGLYADRYALRLDPPPAIAEVVRRVPEEQSLRGKHFGYDVARMVERFVPPDRQVYDFISFPEAYSNKHALMYYTSARANVITETLLTPMDVAPLFGGKPLLSGLSPDLAPVCAMEYRVRARSVSGVRLVQPAGAAGPLWTITDISLTMRGRELPLPAGSRVTASHSRWYAGSAFDASPVTVWSAREPVRKGMFIAVEFASAVELDGLIVRAPRDQQKMRARLEALTGPGRWETLGSEPEVSLTPRPAGLRALAAREVRRQGIDYLLVNEGNPIAADFSEHVDEWGIEKVAAAEGCTLYRIGR
jgi:hypothetical protein